MSGDILKMQEGESSRAYAARVAYIKMGPDRSLDKLAKQRGKNEAGGHITRWSAQWNWAECARAYDSAQPAQPTPAPLPPATPDLDALIDRILRRQEARTLRSLTMSRAMQALIVRLDAALDADEPTLRATVREVLDDLGHAVTWGDERGAA